MKLWDRERSFPRNVELISKAYNVIRTKKNYEKVIISFFTVLYIYPSYYVLQFFLTFFFSF
jgi:hypothetical protein